MNEQINEPLSDYSFSLLNERKTNHGMYICAGDGGRLLTFYLRRFGFRSTRFFQSTDMLVCERCNQMYGWNAKDNTVFPLVVKRKEVIKEYGRQ